jgi:alkylation response protein AidB-like acyl-CoA dehydrogenase
MVGEVFAASVGGGEAELVELGRRHIGVDADGRLADALLRDRITRAAMDEECFLLTVKRMKAMMGATKKAGMKVEPGPESSILKLFGTELNQRRRQLAVEILGEDGLGWSGLDDGALAATREWLRSRGNTIEGGTSEVQLDIIAKHVLGLP